jgi:hypothetical protein
MTVPVQKADPAMGPPFCFGRRAARCAQRKTEFTAVGYRAALRPLQCVHANVMKEFRESATPELPSHDFSSAYPRTGCDALSRGENHQARFFRHFSVMGAGIKTYPPCQRKMLSATPRSLNTDTGLGGVFPAVHGLPQDLVFDSELTSICC